MIKTAVGLSHGDDAYAVGVNACQSAVTQLGGEKPGMILAFASVRYDQEKVLAGILSVAPNVLIVGSSTSGEITSAGPTTRYSVVVMAFVSSDVKFFAAISEPLSKGAYEAGKSVIDSIKKQTTEPLSFLMYFSDPLTSNGSEVLRGVTETVGRDVSVVGASSGDEYQFKKTYQYLNNSIHSDSVVAVGFCGQVKIGVGAKHGWIPIGLPLQVTRSEGSTLRELDGRPAFSVYEDYFGSELTQQIKSEGTFASVASMYPLGIRMSGGVERLIRNPLRLQEDGSIVCTAEIPEGSEVQLMLGSREEAIKSAREAGQAATESVGTLPQAVIVFSSITRKKLLGSYAIDEINSVIESTGGTFPLIGFYTYGEQAPIQTLEKSKVGAISTFQNETVVVTVIG
ncbi:MAG: hypothetical protein EXS46_03810 [Candidatus Taylorbacteria bacterium]|nr:hypothetical protein [Candidatus Taylorbacteria bacterium]